MAMNFSFVSGDIIPNCVIEAYAPSQKRSDIYLYVGVEYSGGKVCNIN